MFLELQALRKLYADSVAVDGLSLSVKKGEFLCILGPSGCGKTTTIGMVGGFILPSEGRIILDNEDVTLQPPHVRPTCTVFQSYALFPHMSVLRNVIYGLKYRNFSRKKAIEAGEAMLDTMGLRHLRDRSVTELSGGEQQRVALARALVLKPKVLLLDEPLSNIDATLRFALRKEIKELQSKFGITMLYVTHDQEEAMNLADRIVIINSGRIEQLGAPEEMYTHPANTFVAQFLGRTNLINKTQHVIAVRPEDVALSSQKGRIKGNVVHRKFSGPLTTYFVNIGQDTLLEVDMMSNSIDQPGIGDVVFVDWKRELILKGKKTEIGT